jgi:iron complex transport system substrate-binding protein
VCYYLIVSNETQDLRKGKTFPIQDKKSGYSLMNTHAISKIYAALILALIVTSVVGASILVSGFRPASSNGNTSLVDMAGRFVQMPAAVNRVIILQSYWTEIACTIGASEKIVGIGKDVATSVFIPENVRNLTNVGSLFSGINLETIVALKPDVVITDFGYGKAGEIIKSLENLNISVICLFASSFQDQQNATLIIGKVLNAEQKALELVNYLDNGHRTITSVSSSIPQNEKPKVVICDLSVWGQGLVYTYINSSWGQTVINVGGINVALDEFANMSWAKINMEKILLWDPDMIIILGRDNATLTTQLKSLNGTAWDQLKAVKNNKVFGMLIGAKDKDAFLDWTPRVLIGEMQLAKYVQPTYFSGLDIASVKDSLSTRYYNSSLMG